MLIFQWEIIAMPPPSTTTSKKPTNLSLDKFLLDEARALKVNLSKAAEVGLRQAVGEAKAAAWKRENARAIESSNRWVDAHGLPLNPYRRF